MVFDMWTVDRTWRWDRPVALVLGLVLVLLAVGIVASSETAGADEGTPSDFKVAFIGDQGLSSKALAVLELIKSEGADMVLHQGDFDYTDSPNAWDQQINDILGSDFPYFASIGNHDGIAWAGYQEKLEARLDRLDGVTCTGDLGVKSACTDKGVFFILSGVGMSGSGHDTFIRDQLAASYATWKICSWHYVQILMQVGDQKKNFVGWEPYEECRKGGAIVATAHEHSYSRTHLMANFETQSIASTSSTLQIEKGKSFAFVSGLGGIGIRSQNDALAANPWWAAVYTSRQSADFGALFCTFNENGVENRAHCYFKDIGGAVPDQFDLQVTLSSPPAVPGVSTVGLWVIGGALAAVVLWSAWRARARVTGASHRQ